MKNIKHLTLIILMAMGLKSLACTNFLITKGVSMDVFT